jgi:hypothetical protein
VISLAAVAAVRRDSPNPEPRTPNVEPRTPPFAVGVLRRDGVVIPFAAFNGKQWRSTWPPPQQELTIPVSVSGVPSRWWGSTGPLDSWQAWIAGAARTLRVTQPDWVEAHCLRQIGLRTDYQTDGAAPPRTVQPYPKDGLAVSPPQAIDRIEILPVAGPRVRVLAPAVLSAFNAAERQTEQRWGHPTPRRSREGVDPTLEAVYAIGESPRVYYIEAIRMYRDLGQPLGECGSAALGSGWFIQEGDAMRSLAMTVDVLRCDRFGASYMLPLGALRVNGRLYWFAQFSGWDHERYVVVDIAPKKVEAVISAWGGGC